MPIKTYSSGMKSRLSFGLSLFFDFDYLIIDETLSVGDRKFQSKSKAALREKIEKSNILLVSHSMPVLKELCDVGIVVHNGTMHYYDSIDEAVGVYDDINS
jgi:capsular polysaccharide transport system ATP-binding protein